MGILSDLLASAETFDAGATRIGSSRHITRQLKNIVRQYGDFDYPSGYSAVNEVQGIAIYSGTVSGGTFTLTFPLTGAVATSGIAFGANAATIQTAVDTSLTGVSGYVAGHVAITGGPLTTTPLVITYSGVSVAGKNQGLVTANGASLTGGGTMGAITQTTAGATKRAAWAALKVLGIITSAPPEQGSGTSTVTVGLGRGQFPFGLSAETVKALIEEATYDDGGIAGVKTGLLAALKF